jgi:hypothetical protein
MISLKIGGFIVAAFVAGAFLASPELRAYAANTIGSADIINNSIQSVDIKDGEIKAVDIAGGAVGASEIATDAVGGPELAGVTKLLFGQCVLTSAETSANVATGGLLIKSCNISGVDADDFAIATLNDGNVCFEVAKVSIHSSNVSVPLRNDCPFTTKVGSPGTIGVIIFDK